MFMQIVITSPSAVVETTGLVLLARELMTLGPLTPFVCLPIGNLPLKEFQIFPRGRP